MSNPHFRRYTIHSSGTGRPSKHVRYGLVATIARNVGDVLSIGIGESRVIMLADVGMFAHVTREV